MNIGWQEFLGFYTGLNVVRKQYDEKFQEQRGIGEECDDPNNSDDEESQQTSQPQLPQANTRSLTIAYKEMGAPNGHSLQQPLLQQPDSKI